MIHELVELKREVNEIFAMSQLNKRIEFDQQKHFAKEFCANIRSEVRLQYANTPEIPQVIETYFKVVSSIKNYVIYRSGNPVFRLTLTNNRFSCLADIELEANVNIPELAQYPYVIGLLYIVVADLDSGNKVGKRFVRQLVCQAHNQSLPVYLYCEPALVSYYQAIGFTRVRENKTGQQLMICQIKN